MDTRRSHWIRQNHQERMPPRMVAFDTESESSYDDEVETQEWKVGCAIRWRTDLKASDAHEGRVFENPREFWTWVSDFTRNGTRTVVWAHNLGHDIRISRMFEILPTLGFRLEWCNLDRNISSATWRSDHGTIVLADTWTWIPLPLNVIAPQVGMVKYEMPARGAEDSEWARYCMRDAEILYNVCRILMAFVSSEGLGNWQPTGAGMAYATWRHKFLRHKVLVHDDRDAIQAERIAMHTGRAEAWRHGEIWGEKWTEIDLRTAYLRIAAECELPRKLHMHHGALSVRQFQTLRARFSVLSRVTVTQELPILPMKTTSRHLWPVGTFDTWVWDNELSMALEYGAEVKIHECYTYAKAPILQDWARWVLAILQDETGMVHPIVRTHVKHCARALIGRIALRAPHWEYYGENIEGITGITHMVFPASETTCRMLHVGQDTLIETSRMEGKDSLPMVTGWIMAECRTRLWDAMYIAGLDNLAHVDTDSVLVNSAGLGNMAKRYGDAFRDAWAVKGTWKRLDIYGPRQYYRGDQRVAAGIPAKAAQVAPGEFAGERWSALASDLERGSAGSVTVSPGQWAMRRQDPRRDDSPGVPGRTVAYWAGGGSSANGSSSTAPSVEQ
jgi:hypothetical protein